MKKRVIFFLSLFGSVVFGQNNMMQNTKDALNVGGLRIGQHTSTMLYGFDSRSTEVLGTYYLDPEWGLATVRFYPKTISTPKGVVKLDSLSDIQIRVILYGNDVEFNTPDGIKVISGTLIKSFTLRKPNQIPQTYISTLEFVDNYDKIKPSFFELLVDGKIKLLEYVKVNILKPDYVEAFNVGSKDIKITKDRQFFITNGSEVLKLKTTKRAILNLMSDKKTAVETFIKQNNLSTKNRVDLLQIFSFYNEKN